MLHGNDRLSANGASLTATGLSERSALQRLERDGPNELPSAKARGVAVLLKEVISEPMVSLLIACGAIYLVLGDRQEAVMLLGFD